MYIEKYTKKAKYNKRVNTFHLTTMNGAIRFLLVLLLLAAGMAIILYLSNAGSRIPPIKKRRDDQIEDYNQETIAAENATKQRSKIEQLVKDILESKLGVKFTTIRPDWLKGYRGKNLEIDLWNEELKLGVEVQGEQHFKRNAFKMTDKQFANQYANDICKIELCNQLNVTLIHVLFFHSTKELIIKQVYTELIRKDRKDLAYKFL